VKLGLLLKWKNIRLWMPESRVLRRMQKAFVIRGGVAFLKNAAYIENS
jgi:hypothetical protein